MRNRSLTMLVVSGLTGVSALGIALWTNTTEQGTPTALTTTAPAPIATVPLVVASRGIKAGDILSVENLTLQAWPEDDVPYGAFQSLDAIQVGPHTRRLALTEIAKGAPILNSRLTLPGTNNALSKRLKPGLRAFTIRIDDVTGVAGFVFPGSFVDVLHTEKLGDAPYQSHILISQVEVLAVDRNADTLTDEPSIADSVTLAVTLDQARALSRSAQDGTLSLALIGDITTDDADTSQPVTYASHGSLRPTTTRTTTTVKVADTDTRAVTIVLGATTTEQSVPKAHMTAPLALHAPAVLPPQRITPHTSAE